MSVPFRKNCAYAFANGKLSLQVAMSAGIQIHMGLTSVVDARKNYLCWDVTKMNKFTLYYSVWYRKIVRNGWRYQQWTDKSGWSDWNDQSNMHTNCPSPYAGASQPARPSCWGFTRLRFWRFEWGWRHVVMRVLWLANKQVGPWHEWIEYHRDKCMLTLTRAHIRTRHKISTLDRFTYDYKTCEGPSFVF